MRLDIRQSELCPDANGTTIGVAQSFTLFCGSNLEADTIGTPDANNIQECVEQCAFFHPKCEGVTFSARDRCRLKAGIVPEGTRPSRFFDGAAAIFPLMPASTCTDGVQAAGSASFNMFCGQIFNGGDLVQSHHQTIQGCMQDCVSNAACTGFSFDQTLSQGFMNCYLKNTINEAGLTGLTSIDSGIVGAAAVVPPAVVPPVVVAPVPSPTNVGLRPLPPATTVIISQPAETVTAAPLPASTVVVSLVPDTVTAQPEPSPEPPADPIQVPGFNTIVPAPAPVEEPRTTAGGAFITLNPAPVASEAVTAITQQTTVQVITSESTIISITQVVPVTITTFRPMSGTPAANATTGANEAAAASGSNNLSWVAAPVVGGIAAVLVVVVMFVMFRKRRSESRSGWSWKPSFGFVSNRKTSSSSSKRWRTSWLGYWRPGAEKLDDLPEEKGRIPVYEVKAGRAELRDQDNPLGQNKPGGIFSRT